MSTLDNSLNLLYKFMAEWGVPDARELRILEVNRSIPQDHKGRFIISRDDLQIPSAYAARFEDLTHGGLAWVNMSCYGFYMGLLIVGIEFPDQVLKANSAVPTSVNYSGPQNRVAQDDWDVSPMLVID